MAEELDDAEFRLPSHFLTDDDILIDLDLSLSSDKDYLVFGSGSDLHLPSNGSLTGSETDQDDLLSELTPQGWNLSSSPQSTLCGCVGKEECSSRDSPNGQVTPPSSTDKEGGATTLELLNKAAGEVARFKISKEKTTTARAGTGFFDCSSKGQFCPPPISTSTHLPFFSPLHFPPFALVQQQMSMRRQQMISTRGNIINKKSNEQNHKNCPLGLPETAWPPLQAQNQPTQRGPQVVMGQPEPKRECVGTGVFLPKRVDTPVETRKKPEGGNPTKTRNKKGNSKGSKSHQRRGSNQPTSKSTEI